MGRQTDGHGFIDSAVDVKNVNQHKPVQFCKILAHCTWAYRVHVSLCMISLCKEHHRHVG